MVANGRLSSSMLVAFGRFWSLLVAFGRFWSPLVATERFDQKTMVAFGRFWSLFGNLWSPLVATERFDQKQKTKGPISAETRPKLGDRMAFPWGDGQKKKEREKKEKRNQKEKRKATRKFQARARRGSRPIKGKKIVFVWWVKKKSQKNGQKKREKLSKVADRISAAIGRRWLRRPRNKIRGGRVKSIESNRSPDQRPIKSVRWPFDKAQQN